MDAFEGYSPREASDFIAEKLNLNADGKAAVFRVLDQTDEDPVLVIRLNPHWNPAPPAQAQAPPANGVLDAIATFRMPQGERRDEEARRLCFHFALTRDIDACREFLLNDPLYANVFALTPAAIACGAIGNSEPMGFCAEVHKIEVKISDVRMSKFFYM